MYWKEKGKNMIQRGKMFLQIAERKFENHNDEKTNDLHSGIPEVSNGQRKA